MEAGPPEGGPIFSSGLGGDGMAFRTAHEGGDDQGDDRAKNEAKDETEYALRDRTGHHADEAFRLLQLLGAGAAGFRLREFRLDQDISEARVYDLNIQHLRDRAEKHAPE